MVSTTNYGFYQPLVNNATDSDLWGGELNTDLSQIDGVLLTAMNWTPTTATTTITVTAPTAGSTTTGSAKLLYLCSTAGGAYAANLPAVATASGMTVAFKKTDALSNSITITGNAAELIDGVNTFILSTQYQYVVLACDGTHWDIVAQTAPAATPVTDATISVSDVTTNNVSTSAHGWTPKAPNNTTTFLRGDATYAVPVMTALGIGSIVQAYTLAGSRSPGATIAGGSLVAANAAGTPTGDSLAGTWQALQTVPNDSVGLWQRTA